MRRRSDAWWAKRRCYRFSKEDLRAVTYWMEVMGLTLNEAVEQMKRLNPQFKIELEDTRRATLPQECC